MTLRIFRPVKALCVGEFAMPMMGLSQEEGKERRISCLSVGAGNLRRRVQYQVDAVPQGRRDSSWTDGQSIAVEYCWGTGDRLTEIGRAHV
jgi:hypothetical protein